MASLLRRNLFSHILCVTGWEAGLPSSWASRALPSQHSSHITLAPPRHTRSALSTHKPLWSLESSHFRVTLLFQFRHQHITHTLSLCPQDVLPSIMDGLGIHVKDPPNLPASVLAFLNFEHVPPHSLADSTPTTILWNSQTSTTAPPEALHSDIPFWTTTSTSTNSFTLALWLHRSLNVVSPVPKASHPISFLLLGQKPQAFFWAGH